MRGRKVLSRDKKPRVRNSWNSYICTDPEGKEYVVHDLVQFCRVFNLAYGAMVNCANGWSATHKDWRCEHLAHRGKKE